MNIEALLQKGAEDDAAGARYLTVTRTETLREATIRRLRMAWQCWTLRPPDDFYEEWLPFRKGIITYQKVWPGEPGYDEAFSRQTEHFIYRKTLAANPWLALSSKAPFPNSCGPIYPPTTP